LVAVIVNENIDLSLTEVLVIVNRNITNRSLSLSLADSARNKSWANRMNCIRRIALHWKVIRSADACVLGVSWLIVLASTVSRWSSQVKPYNAISGSSAVVRSLKQSHSDYVQCPLCEMLGTLITSNFCDSVGYTENRSLVGRSYYDYANHI